LLIVFIARKEKEENSSCFDFSVWRIAMEIEPKAPRAIWELPYSFDLISCIIGTRLNILEIGRRWYHSLFKFETERHAWCECTEESCFLCVVSCIL
jgi:hypothetical protein